MGDIRKRINAAGTVSYQAQVRLKGYPQQTQSFKRKTDARKWISATESAINEGRHFKTAEAKKHTYNEVADKYSKQIVPTKKDFRNVARHIEYWKSQLGSYVLADLTPSLIVEARDNLRNGNRSDSTVNRYMTSLSHSLNIAMNEWGWIEDTPIRKIKKLKEPRGRIRYLSEDERERLLDVCQQRSNKDLYHAVVLSLSTGARKNEIMSLKWKQIDFKRNVIVLYETKNNEVRLLPLVNHALEIVRERSRIRRLDTNLVFPSVKNPLVPIDLKHPFEEALEEAEIKDFRWHDLRHTTASYLAMNGASLAEIAEVLGHKTLAMVKRYAHLSEAHTTSVVESMNKRMFGA